MGSGTMRPSSAQAITQAAGHLNALAGIYAGARATAAKHPAPTPGDSHYMLYTQAGMDGAMLSAWRTGGRQVVAMDPDLANALADSDGTYAPATFPYSVPYITLPAPPKVAASAGGTTTGYLAGYLVCGIAGGTVPAGAAALVPGAVPAYGVGDPTADRICIMAMVDVVDSATGKQIDVEVLRATIGFDEVPGTPDSFVPRIVARGAVRAFDRTGTDADTYLHNVLRYAVGGISYLAGTTTDTQRLPAATTSRAWARTGSTGGNAKPPKADLVGWRVGPKIGALYAPRAATAPGTRRSPAPQVVRGHFRLYWCGPARTIPRTKFIAPHTRGDGTPPPTLHHAHKEG